MQQMMQKLAEEYMYVVIDMYGWFRDVCTNQLATGITNNLRRARGCCAKLIDESLFHHKPKVGLTIPIISCNYIDTAPPGES